MAPFAHPGMVFRGKTYKTITGLYNALYKHAPSANSIGGVSSSNTITATNRTKDGEEVVAIFCITPPVAGQKQYVAPAFLPSELDKARRNALVASAYNTCIGVKGMKLPGGQTMSSVGLPGEPRKFVMDCAMADTLPQNLRSALLCVYAEELMREQQTGQQMIYTFADCQAALKFVNA